MNSVPGAPMLMGVSCSTELPDLDLSEESSSNDEDPSLKGISANLVAMRLMGVNTTKTKKSPTPSFTGTDNEALRLLRD